MTVHVRAESARRPRLCRFNHSRRASSLSPTFPAASARASRIRTRAGVSEMSGRGSPIRPYPREDMAAYAVGLLVNSPSDDSPRCVELLTNAQASSLRYTTRLSDVPLLR